MGLKVSTAATIDPVTTAEAKTFARIDTSDDDTLVAALISAATAYVQTYLSRQLINATYQLTLDWFPYDGLSLVAFYRYGGLTSGGDTLAGGTYWPPPGRFGVGTGAIILPRSPLSSVTSIVYTDANQSDQTLSSTLYRVDTVQEPPRITPAYNQTWPVTSPIINAITITFVVGYGATTANVPQNLRIAIMQLVAHWYENREAAMDTSYEHLPLATRCLLDQERVCWL